MIECWRSGYWDYDFGNTCTSFGGCSFLDVCSTQDEVRWLEASFERTVWNPIKADVEKSHETP
jgi:hypothetical protein